MLNQKFEKIQNKRVLEKRTYSLQEEAYSSLSLLMYPQLQKIVVVKKKKGQFFFLKKEKQREKRKRFCTLRSITSAFIGDVHGDGSAIVLLLLVPVLRHGRAYQGFSAELTRVSPDAAFTRERVRINPLIKSIGPKILLFPCWATNAIGPILGCLHLIDWVNFVRDR